MKHEFKEIMQGTTVEIGKQAYLILPDGRIARTSPVLHTILGANGRDLTLITRHHSDRGGDTSTWVHVD